MDILLLTKKIHISQTIARDLISDDNRLLIEVVSI